ncbi:MAG: hypothetical protein NTW14_06610 [bacterium]|nr:hypothetical protein [bacterium]
MSNIWYFLSGEVPGGLFLLIVLLLILIVILEFVRRVGQTMPTAICRRWQIRGSLIIVLAYALVWIGSPPRLDPLRIALLADSSQSEPAWLADALVDLTSRSLQRTLPQAVINPWAGAFNEYPQPGVGMLDVAKYHVYQIQCRPGADKSAVKVLKLHSATHDLLIDSNDLPASCRKIAKLLLDDLGKKSEAAEPFTKPLNPNQLASLYRAEFWLANTAPDSAQLIFQSVLDSDSTFSLAHLYLAGLFERKGDFAGAQNHYLAAARLETDANRTFLDLGEFYLRQHDWANAEPPLKVVAAKYPQTARVYYDLIHLHPARLLDLRLNTPEKLLREGLRLDPANEALRLQLVNLFIKVDGLTSQSILNDGLKINPKSIPLLLKLGAAQLYSGNVESSKKTYNRILAFESKNATAVFNLGVIDYRAKKYSQCVENFTRSLEWGGPVDCFYFLGLAYTALGKADLAKAAYQKRWELRSGKDDAFAELARRQADSLKTGSSE